MLRRLRPLLLGMLCVAALPAVAQAEGSDAQARAWLDRMITARHALNYDGTFVFQYGGQMGAMRIVHGAAADGERERLVALTGAAREILRNHGQTTCILPDARSVMVEPARAGGQTLPHEILSSADGLDKHYTFGLGGQDRVVGREAQIVTVLPRDAYRYGYRLWLDKQHALMLKSELVDERGRTLETLMFTALKVLDHVPNDALHPAISGQEFSWHHKALQPESAKPSSRWRVTRLPVGFVLRVAEEQKRDEHDVEHLVYSDGLASVSVFIEPADHDEDELLGPSRLGAVHAFGRRIGKRQVLVVGEVPAATVEMMAKSLQAAGG